SPLLPLLRRRYRALLPRLVGRPKVAVGGGGGLLVASALAVPFLGEDFLPHFREFDFLMHWVEKPGTSLEAGGRATLAASKELRAGPGGARAGGGARGPPGRQQGAAGRARRAQLRVTHRPGRGGRRGGGPQLHRA